KHSDAIYILDIQSGTLRQIANAPQPIIGFTETASGIALAYSREKIYMVTHGEELQTIYTSVNATIKHVSFDGKSRILWLSTNKGLIKLSRIEGLTNLVVPSRPQASMKVISIAETPDRSLWL